MNFSCNPSVVLGCLKPTWVWLDASCSWVRSCTWGIFTAFDSEIRWTMCWGSIVATWQHRMTVPGDLLLGSSLCTVFFPYFFSVCRTYDFVFAHVTMWPVHFWHFQINKSRIGAFWAWIQREEPMTIVTPCHSNCWKSFGKTNFEIHFKTLEIPYFILLYVYTQLINTWEARCLTKGLTYASRGAPSCQLSKSSKTKMVVLMVFGVRKRQLRVSEVDLVHVLLVALVPWGEIYPPSCGPAPRRSLATGRLCWRASSQDLAELKTACPKNCYHVSLLVQLYKYVYTNHIDGYLAYRCMPKYALYVYSIHTNNVYLPSVICKLNLPHHDKSNEMLHNILFHILRDHVVAYHIRSYPFMSCRIISCQIISEHFVISGFRLHNKYMYLMSLNYPFTPEYLRKHRHSGQITLWILSLDVI